MTGYSPHRRTFLRQAATGMVGAAVFPPTWASSSGFARKKWGIILNTVRNEMKVDVAGTLEQLATMGYRYIEGGVYGEDEKGYANLLRRLKLKAIAGGSSLSDLQKTPETYIRRGHLLGYEYISCYWPWLSSANQLSYDECMQAAEHLNALGRQFHREGLKLAWHNHDKEFVPIGDVLAFDLLMQETDPEYVCGMMDLYWVRKGGGEPVDYFRKYPGRFELVHVKDMAADEAQSITCVGEGIIDFEAIFEHRALAGIRYMIVEHERSTDGLRCARVSAQHMKSIS